MSRFNSEIWQSHVLKSTLSDSEIMVCISLQGTPVWNSRHFEHTAPTPWTRRHLATLAVFGQRTSFQITLAYQQAKAREDEYTPLLKVCDKSPPIHSPDAALSINKGICMSFTELWQWRLEDRCGTKHFQSRTGTAHYSDTRLGHTGVTKGNSSNST